MLDEDIIKNWRMGYTKMKVAKEYMKSFNKSAERRRESKIKINQALEYVEPIIFKYETKDWSKTKNEV